jgi:hypothetical protein
MGLVVAVFVVLAGSFHQMTKGDRVRPVLAQECASALMMAADVRRRIEALDNPLEDDVVMYGRFPDGRWEPRLLARTHQPLIWRARKEASRNVADLQERIRAADCDRPMERRLDD